MSGCWVSINDAAHLSGVPARTIRRWVSEDRLQARQAGATRIRLEDIDELTAHRGTGGRLARIRIVAIPFGKSGDHAPCPPDDEGSRIRR